MRYRTRTCSNPAPLNGGKICEGIARETKQYNTAPCPAKVGLRPVTRTVLENIGSFQVLVFRSGNSIGTNKVLVSTIPGSALPSKDYIHVPETEVIFKPGEATKKVTITIIDDKILEGLEVFLVHLRSNDPGVTEVSPASSKITIIDDDVQIGLKQTKYSVRESDGCVVLNVFRTGYLKNTNTAILNTCDQTAMAPADYHPLKDVVVTFASSEMHKEVKIKIVDDKILEKIETFFAKLTTKDHKVSVVSPAKALIHIVDNDVKVGFRPATYNVIESSTYVPVKVYRVGNINSATKVILNTNDGTTKANSDYGPLVNFPVIFAAGQTMKSIRVQIINNRVVESVESFTIMMTSSDRDVTMITPNVASVKIVDDDAIIGFEKTKYSVAETARAVKVVLKRTGATQFQHSAILFSRDGTASSPRDYQGIRSTVITFAANELNKEVFVRINDDNLEEGLENFRLILTTRDPRVIVRPRVASIDIIDNDVNGRWSDWSDWSACGKTCGLSTQSRIRDCTPPLGGGHPCVGPAKQVRRCFIRRFCPVNGGFSNWSRWSRCSRSCGRGSSSRVRACNNPIPRFGGAPCRGATRQFKTCNEQCCPVNGMWGSWGSWSSCSISCRESAFSYGIRVRRRLCNNPAPSCNGRFCFGGSAAARQVVRCFPNSPCFGSESEPATRPPNQYGVESQSVTKPPNQYGVESQSVTKPANQYGGESQPATQAPPSYGGESQPATQAPHPYGGESQPATQAPHPYGGESQPAAQGPHPYGGESQPATQAPHPYGSNPY
ncbi:extracellular matrix protein 3-like [Actinia tenebrosa]|uniref:Extracellular matrix protein 3-like n=1 Tax=Actinia tenebrosa TaxID=6105 RepID=A0A6P8IRF6_ACTTE|nr:extracellular matrix protein 3-like [Actinia tenebrosa]